MERADRRLHDMVVREIEKAIPAAVNVIIKEEITEFMQGLTPEQKQAISSRFAGT